VECNTGFYENSGACSPRTANQNCLTFEISQDKCKTCEEKVRYLKNSTTCDLYTAQKCDTYEAAEDKCITCIATAWKDTSNSTVVCKDPTTVDGCKTYSTVVDACIACDTMFYQDNTGATLACPARTVIANCTTYATATDDCSVCEEGRYYNSAAKECRVYPVGKSNCGVYTFPDTCVQCDSGYFLDGGNCTQVTTPLDGCLVHKSQTACETCDPATRILNGDVCDTIVTKTGCIEYSDKDTCKTCNPQYFLEAGACVDSGITGCIEPIKGDTNTCNKCSTDRYLNAEKTSCTLGTAVPGCAAYKSQTECSLCSATKILSADGTKCDPITDLAGANCSIGSTLADPVCDVCMYGYKKDATGACVAITSSDCVTEDSAGKCLLCMPGTYMDKDSKCTKPTPPACDPATDPDCEFAAIRSAFMMMLAFFMINLF
jgi:hypothetical protein